MGVGVSIYNKDVDKEVSTAMLLVIDQVER